MLTSDLQLLDSWPNTGQVQFLLSFAFKYCCAALIFWFFFSGVQFVDQVLFRTFSFAHLLTVSFCTQNQTNFVFNVCWNVFSKFMSVKMRHTFLGFLRDDLLANAKSFLKQNNSGYTCILINEASLKAIFLSIHFFIVQQFFLKAPTS